MSEPAGPYRLLVVDDTEANRYVVARHLRSAGYLVEECGTGRDALTKIRSSLPNLVILDIRLPDISGLEVARELRADERTSGIPILHISASYTDTASRALGLDNGADGYLTHPIEPVVLMATVRALLRAQEAEREFRETARQWTVTFDAIGEGVCVTDAGGAILRCNRAFEELLDFRIQPGDARPVWIIAPPLAALASTPEDQRRADSRPIRIDIGDRTLRATVVVPRSEGPESEGAVWVVSDLTRERRADERVRRALQLETTGRLAGGVAHEVNNMMTAVLSYAEFALRGFAPDDPRRADIEGIHAAATRSAQVARQLLTFSRRQVIQPQTLDLHSLIREMGGTLLRLLGADKKLQLNLSAESPWVAVDPIGFEQILINLALNARDAMPHGGQLAIRTSNVVLDQAMVARHPDIAIQCGPYIQLTLSDTGHGMSRETLDRVFDPFFTTKDVGQGTGLGLATVFGMVKQSAGYIWAESEPGRGATFILQFPQVQAEPAVHPEPVAVSSPGSGSIVIVEDEPIVLRLLGRGLRESGYQVKEASDGRQGLDCVAQLDGQVDLVITDVVMPNMNGREMAAQIRERWPQVPILFISGYTNDDVVSRGLLTLGEAFLQKPFHPAALAAQVRELIGSRQEVQQP